MIAFPQLLAIGCYITILLVIGFLASRHHQTASDFIIGGRSLNFFLTALAAQASDMSAWLFIGFPFLIFTRGLFNVWNGVGMVLFMFLNWVFVAKRLRIKTEEYASLTLPSFFESRFRDTSGMIRIFTSIITLVFYIIYVTAGIIGMGLIIETLFGIDYRVGITIGTSLTVVYLFIGGYRGLAWVDCFQALFLLCVIIAVPAIIWPKVGGWAGISIAFAERSLPIDLLPNFSLATISSLLFILIHWGLGYFGQPHIITKFMGIKDPKKLYKSTIVGVSWQTIALGASTLIGMIGVPYFSKGIANSELIFVNMVKENFPLVVMSFILCAVFAAILSTLDSQILILASNMTEDFYRKIIRKKAGSKELLWVSRFFVLLTAVVAYAFALGKVDTIYRLVFYAWAGLGASFGPILLFALFSKKTNKYGACAGILSGAVTVNLWYFLIHDESALIAGFLVSSIFIFLTTQFTQHKTRHQKIT